MSYARFGPNSDVYVYQDPNGSYVCCGCKRRFISPPSPELIFGQFEGTVEEIILHLVYDHQQRGDKVPHDAITDLFEEWLNQP